MIMFAPFSRAFGWGCTTEAYSGTGADIVMESISLKTPDFGEEKAQSCAIACSRHLSSIA
jgi:hypothetical protein